MTQCYTCHNEYAKCFQITTPQGQNYTFDCFECAIHALAPNCQDCGCKIIGHGIEAGENFYCCANCARTAGVTNVQDHAA